MSDSAKIIDDVAKAMLDTSKAPVHKVRETMHRLVDESCDQLNLDVVDAKYDAEEAE